MKENLKSTLIHFTRTDHTLRFHIHEIHWSQIQIPDNNKVTRTTTQLLFTFVLFLFILLNSMLKTVHFRMLPCLSIPFSFAMFVLQI
jgi:hypothetical protein